MGLTTSTFKHAVIYGSAAAVGKLVGLFMLPIYAHTFGPAGYGVIGMVNTSLAFALSLMSHGLGVAILRIYHEQDEPSKNTVVTTGVTLVAGAALGLGTLGAACSVPLSHLLLGDGSYYPLICLAFATFFLDLTGDAAGSVLVIRQRSLVFSIVGIFRLVLGLSLNVYLIVILQMGLLGFFIANLVTAAVGASTFLFLCVRSCGFGFDLELARSLLRFQAPLIPGSMAAWGGAQFEKIIVRYQIGIENVGILSMAGRFPALIWFLVFAPFMQSWNTKRIELAEKDPAKAAITIGAMYSYVLYVLLFVGLLLAANIDAILRLITPSEFWPAARLVRIYVVTTILGASAGYLNLGLFLAKETKLLSLIRIVGTALSVVLSYVFVTLWAFDGVAFAGCATAMVILPWSATAAQRRFRIVLQYRKIALMTACAGLLYVIVALGPVQALPGIGQLGSFLGSEGVEIVRRTPLGEVRDGAVLEIVKSHGDDLALVIVKTLLCLPFGFLAPVVRGAVWSFVRRAEIGGPGGRNGVQ